MEQIGINDLRLFPEFARESYEAATGQQAPPFNPDKPVKTWLDPAGAGNYSQLVMGYPPSFAPLVMTPEEAKAVNLPGSYRYPKYVPDPTVAQLRFFTLPLMPYPAGQLASLADAQAIAAAVSGVVVEVSLASGMSIVWGSETRRTYEIKIGAAPSGNNNVGWLLSQKGAAGVGVPGKWNVSAGTITWESVPTATAPVGASLAVVPMPVRVLTADEEFYSTPFGWVVRPKEVAPPSGSGGDTAEILRLVTAMARMMGIQ